MGLYTGNLGNYYAGLEEYGAYQFVTINDIITNFKFAYVGEDKIITKVPRADIRFHALRGLQELSYDTFRSFKTLELEVPPYLQLPIPHDYVDYTKISWVDAKGRCRTIRQCKSCPKDPLSYRQHETDHKEWLEGDIDVGDAETIRLDDILVDTQPAARECKSDKVDIKHLSAEKCCPTGYKFIVATRQCEKYQPNYSTTSWDGPIIEDSTTWENLQSTSTTDINMSVENKDNEDTIYQTNAGRRYGIDPLHSNVNGCFWINSNPSHPDSGKIYFDSNLAGKTVTIQYMSDGIASEGDMVVDKFAEEAMYKHIAWSILNTRANTDRNMVAMFKKERTAAVRNAKLRLSSIKLEEITQIMRGKSKWIKH